MVPCLVIARRCLSPTTPSSQRHLCVPALSSSHPFLSPFNFELSTSNLFVRCLPARLRLSLPLGGHLERSERSAFRLSTLRARRLNALNPCSSLPPNIPTFAPANLETTLPLSSLPATLTDGLQLIENSATLSPFAATLTRHVTLNPFVCHSYKKHPGWGYPVPAKSLCAFFDLAAVNSNGIRTSKTRHLKSFRIRTYKKRGEGPASSRPYMVPTQGGTPLSGSRAAAQESHKLAELIKINIRRISAAIVHTKPVIHRRSQGAGVARRLHVYFGIADQQRFARFGAQLTQDRSCAKRVGLLCFKTVSAIDGSEIFRKAHLIQNPHADPHWFVGQNGHRHVRQFF